MEKEINWNFLECFLEKRQAVPPAGRKTQNPTANDAVAAQTVQQLPPANTALDQIASSGQNVPINESDQHGNRPETELNDGGNRDDQEEDDLMDTQEDGVEVLPESAEAKQLKSVQRNISRMAQFAASDQIETLGYEGLRLRNDRLTALWEKADDLFLVLVSQTDENPGLVLSYEESIGITEEEYFEASTNFRQKMLELERREAAANPSATNQEGIDAGKKEIKVILPLQEHDMKNTWGYFDGSNEKEWLGFRDRFKAAILDKTEISEAYKLSYLTNSLKGAAARTLGNCHVANESVQVAWDRLMAVYNNVYKIARAHLRDFYQLPMLQTPVTSADLQHMSNVTHETIRQLRALELPVEHWDFVFVHALHERLDDATARQWNLIRSSSQPTILEMTDFLDKEASAATSATKEQDQLTITIRNKDKSNASSRSSTPVGRTQMQRNNTGTVPKQYPCEACPGTEFHPIFKCPNFLALNLNARKDFAYRRRLCENCLKKGHHKNACDDVRRCTLAQCQANPLHNSLLCPGKQTSQVLTVSGGAGAIIGKKKGD